MNLGKQLAATAIMGILSACGGAQTDAKPPTTDPNSAAAGGHNACGNHPDGGSCGAKESMTSPAKK